MHIFNSYTVHSKHIKLKIQHNLGKNKKNVYDQRMSPIPFGQDDGGP